MSSRGKKIAWGTLLTAVGMVVGGFIQWSATERRLSIHIATADDKVALMCDLAEYQMQAAEAMCAATGAKCKERPDGLRREVLSKRCP